MTMINQTVAIDSYFFRAENSGDHIKTYPRRMEFGNRQYTFQDGLRRLVRRGQRVFELFDMTDGQTVFRLARLDSPAAGSLDSHNAPHDEWRLIATRAGERQMQAA